MAVPRGVTDRRAIHELAWSQIQTLIAESEDPGEMAYALARAALWLMGQHKGDQAIADLCRERLLLTNLRKRESAP